ncbi:MAG: hypothetical protein ACPLXM_04990 [Bacteroidales bacterium]|nr:hypothetical protein [Bacteroidales bacterium]
MASRRDLKKDLNYITWELISECLVYQILHPEVSDEKIMQTIEEIAAKHNELLALVNAPENRHNHELAKKNYLAVRKGFVDMVQIINTLPTS